MGLDFLDDDCGDFENWQGKLFILQKLDENM